MRNKAIATLAIVASLLGCEKSPVIPEREAEFTRIEIYYRNFDSLSPISQSKEDLIRVAPTRMSVDEASLIREFLGLLPTDCNPIEDMTKGKLDYYLLANLYHSGELEREFGSSGLAFVDERHFPGLVCQLEQSDRNAIDAWLQSSN